MLCYINTEFTKIQSFLKVRYQIRNGGECDTDDRPNHAIKVILQESTDSLSKPDRCSSLRGLIAIR